MAIAPIVIDVMVKGMPQVQQSFRGVQDAAARAERAMQRDAERAEKARVAAAVIGVGVLAAEATKSWVDRGFAAESSSANARLGNQLSATNMIAKLRSGKWSAEDQAQAEAMQLQLATDLSTMRGERDSPSLVKMVTGAVGNVVAPEAMQEAQTKEYVEQTRSIQNAKKALDELTAALQGAAHAAGNAPSSSGPNGAGRSEPIINR